MELSKKEVIKLRNQLLGNKIMDFENIKKCIWRGIGGLASAMAGMVLFCLTFMSYENAFLLSSIVSLFVLPSVLLFVLFEKIYQKAWLKHLVFFLPVAIVIELSIYSYFSTRLIELEQGLGDGGLQMVIIMTSVYFNGIIIAYVFLLLRGILIKGK